MSVQTPEVLAAKPDAEATFFERTAQRALVASIARDGVKEPDDHAVVAIRATEALIARLAQRGAA